MLKIKTLSNERIKKYNRAGLRFTILNYTLIFILVWFENGILYTVGLLAILMLGLVFFRRDNGKLETGYLEIEGNEVRVLNEHNITIQKLPFENLSSLKYHNPGINWLKAIVHMVDYPTLTIQSEGNQYTFNVLIDSKMKEKQLKERLQLAF